jgi:hypothetical protein
MYALLIPRAESGKSTMPSIISHQITIPNPEKILNLPINTNQKSLPLNEGFFDYMRDCSLIILL